MITTLQAMQLNIPRWIVLALPDDVSQIIELVNLEFNTPHRRKVALQYYIKELRRTQWDRIPTKRPKKPGEMKKSRQTSGYRYKNHTESRLKVSKDRRIEIARMGGINRWKEGNSLNH